MPYGLVGQFELKAMKMACGRPLQPSPLQWSAPPRQLMAFIELMRRLTLTIASHTHSL